MIAPTPNEATTRAQLIDTQLAQAGWSKSRRGYVEEFPPPAFKIKTADDEQNSEIVVTVKLIPLWARDMSTPSMQDPRLTEAEFAAA